MKKKDGLIAAMYLMVHLFSKYSALSDIASKLL